MPKRPTIAERTLLEQIKRIEADMKVIGSDIAAKQTVLQALQRQIDNILTEIERLRAKP